MNLHPISDWGVCAPPTRKRFVNTIRLNTFLFFNLFLLSLNLQAQVCETFSQFTVEVQGNNVVFTAVDPNFPGAIYSWEWSGNTVGVASGVTISLSKSLFSLSLPTFVTLHVQNDFDSGECEKTIFGGIECEAAGFGTDISSCMVDFSPVTPPGNILSETWNFGDGSPEVFDNNTPTHVFANSGTYNVCHNVVVSDFSNPDIIRIYCCCQLVTVNCPITPSCDFTLMEEDDCCRLNVYFESQFQGGVHSWNFGDGTISSEVNPVHQYTNINTSITPTVTIIHTVTYQGQTLTCTKMHTFSKQAIYVGKPDEITSMGNVESSIDGQPLFLFPDNEVDGEEIHVDGILFADIQPHFTFSNCQICMIPEAGIDVDSKVGIPDLRIENNTDIRNKEDENCAIWRSIDMYTNARLTIIEESTIKDAYFGVQTLNGSNQMVLEIRNANFMNNYISLFLRGNFTLPQFQGNQFTFVNMLDGLGGLPDNLFPGYNQGRSFAGIYARNTILNIINLFWFIPMNSFDNLANGIVCVNTDAIIRDCRFTNMAAGPYAVENGNGIRFISRNGNSLRQSGFGDDIFIVPSFDNCQRGIRVDASNTPAVQVQSQFNRMVNMIMGYDINTTQGGRIGTSTNNATIFRNNITVTRTGIDFNSVNSNPSFLNVNLNNITIIPTPIQGIARGLFISDGNPMNSSSQNIFLTTNTINANQGGRAIEFSNTKGITASTNIINIQNPLNLGTGAWAIFSFGCQNTTLDGNIINSNASQTNSTFGIRIADSPMTNVFNNTMNFTGTGLRFSLGCLPSLISCNTFNNNNTVGLILLAGTAVGSQIDNRNIWLGNFGTGASATNGGTAADNDFRRAFAGNQFPPSTFPVDWFSTGGPTNCPPFFQGPPTSDLLENLVATSGIDIGVNSPAYKWNLQRQLFKRLDLYPGLSSSSPEISTFFNTYPSQTGGQLYTIGASIAALYTISPTDMSTLENLSLEISDLLDDIVLIDGLIETLVSNNGDPTVLLGDRTIVYNQIKAKETQSEQIIQPYTTARINATNGIATTNDAISVSASYDESERRLNNILLNTEVKNLPPTIAQKDMVRAIAEMCPLVGGLSVYQARAIYAAWADVRIENEDCGANTNNDEEENALLITNSLKVVPNPADEEFQVFYPNFESDENVLLELISSTGQILNIFEIPSMQGHYQFSTTHLANGFYYLKLIVNGKMIETTKIVIQH